MGRQKSRNFKRKGVFMVNINKLKAKLAECGVTTKEYAEALNISVQALNKKFSGKVKFSIDDAEKTCAFLKIENPSEKCAIFLA